MPAASLSAVAARESHHNITCKILFEYNLGILPHFSHFEGKPMGAKCHLGNPLTTSNVVHGKSRIRFLGEPGGILLKILGGKIHDFLRFTSNRHKCFEKDLFTIVVAMSTESYFPLHFC